MSARKIKKTNHKSSDANSSAPVSLRIIGGSLGGRKLIYHGDRCTRPMKERVREAIFNLIGPSIKGKHAVDLFAGTGALGLEAVSRGATGATFIEQHYPTAKVLQENIDQLNLQSCSTLHTGNTFFFLRKMAEEKIPDFGDTPWAVFISPPYDFYIDREADMLNLLNTTIQRAPEESVIIVESDERFDTDRLPHTDDWDVRTYSPAVVAMWRK